MATLPLSPGRASPHRKSFKRAAWLREHPGAQVTARDRSGAHAEGAWRR